MLAQSIRRVLRHGPSRTVRCDTKEKAMSIRQPRKQTRHRAQPAPAELFLLDLTEGASLPWIRTGHIIKSLRPIAASRRCRRRRRCRARLLDQHGRALPAERRRHRRAFDLDGRIAGSSCRLRHVSRRNSSISIRRTAICTVVSRRMAMSCARPRRVTYRTSSRR